LAFSKPSTPDTSLRPPQSLPWSGIRLRLHPLRRHSSGRIRVPNKPKDAFDRLTSPAPTLGGVQKARTGTSASRSGPESSSANLTVPGIGTTYSWAGSSRVAHLVLHHARGCHHKAHHQRRLLRRPGDLHSPLSRKRSQMHPSSTLPWSSAFLHSRTSTVHYCLRRPDHLYPPPRYFHRTRRKARLVPLPSSFPNLRPVHFPTQAARVLEVNSPRRSVAVAAFTLSKPPVPHRSSRAMHEHRSVNAPDHVFRSFRLRLSRAMPPKRQASLTLTPPVAKGFMPNEPPSPTQIMGPP
jgi:hypothetical protein